MINNIPTEKEYFVSGKELLDFSWDTVAELLINLDQAEDWGFEVDEVSEKYWEASIRRLTTALSIAQQGVEFLLKGKISQISPYLLIADSPQKWPSPYQKKNVDFSDFRTIDAQDLIRVHDTFSANQLETDFVNRFNSLRKKRNAIMHSVNKNITVHVTEVIESILFMHKTLLPHESWAAERLKFLESAPDAELGSYEFATNRICWELSLVIKLLPPSQVKFFFNIDKKQRAYFCPVCWDAANKDGDFDIKLAILRPKGPKSTELYCPVCNIEHEVYRQKCQNGCKGNVIGNDGMCLTCCEYNDIE